TQCALFSGTSKELLAMSEIRELVEGFLNGEVSVRDLHYWIVLHTTWLMNSPRDADRELADIVALTLDEMSMGHATTEDLHETLRERLGSTGRLIIDLDNPSRQSLRADANPTLATIYIRPRQLVVG